VFERGRAVALGGPRQRTLLALLLTRANEVVSRDRLIDVLWNEEPPRTASNALHYHVSQLRKVLGAPAPIVTREPGYMIEAGPDELDLLCFEQLVEAADGAPPDGAARLLREALALWRGPPLADLADEPFAQNEMRRLEELRLLALERRLEADRLLGRDRELVAELEALVREHPLRESFRAELMRALYRARRQAEALAVYREGRSLLVTELGLEPSPELQELEQAILRQDPALEAPELAAHREQLGRRGVSVRVAAYTTTDPGADTALLAAEHDVDLVLVDPPVGLLESGRIEGDLAVLLERAPCDVGVLVGSGDVTRGPVVTPFGGVEHDWSAIELAAWLAGSLGTSLRLLGAKGDASLGRRDASRLLARASLLVQQVVGIVTEPVLVAPGEEGVLEASRDAGLLVVGLSERWRAEGLGTTRLAVASAAGVPTLFVRRGLRPSGVAPPETMTRFTWTIATPRER
jgi:DNA-binding SARP family transcriptional activator